MSDVTQPNDNSIYWAHNVVIKKTIIEIEGINYPINGIVRFYIKKRNIVIEFVVSLLSAALAYGTYTTYESKSVYVFGAVAGIAAIIAITKNHTLVINTSATGVTHRYRSWSFLRLSEMEDALRKAVHERG